MRRVDRSVTDGRTKCTGVENDVEKPSPNRSKSRAPGRWAARAGVPRNIMRSAYPRSRAPQHNRCGSGPWYRLFITGTPGSYHGPGPPRTVARFYLGRPGARHLRGRTRSRNARRFTYWSAGPVCAVIHRLCLPPEARRAILLTTLDTTPQRHLSRGALWTIDRQVKTPPSTLFVSLTSRWREARARVARG
jgi:hypothetical protein